MMQQLKFKTLAVCIGLMIGSSAYAADPVANQQNDVC